MKRIIAFFEIPASDFHRAVKFYESVFSTKLPIIECETEKMAFFHEKGTEQYAGAISWAENFSPSANGVLISFNCKDIDCTLSAIVQNKGVVVTPKTKIEAEGRGYFAVFKDSEGNHVGLYEDK